MSNIVEHKNEHDAQVIGMFLATVKGGSSQTAKVYEGTINEFFRFLEFKTIQKISHQDLLDYAAHLSAADYYREPHVLATSTQNRKIATIKSLFKYAQEIGYIQLNPAAPIKTKRVDAKTAQRLLSPEELRALLIAAAKLSLTHSLVVYFFAGTGCRVSELANCMWENFFVGSNGDICVAITGKGNKTRVLKIDPNLWNYILRYRNEVKLNACIDPNDLSPLLINRQGNKYSTVTLWQFVKDATALAGIQKKVSPHWLRHTFATEVAKSETVNLWQLQEDMGHANITTTQIYVHIAQGMKNTSVDHLEYMGDLNLIINTEN